jgi:hypothetical protein
MSRRRSRKCRLFEVPRIFIFIKKLMQFADHSRRKINCGCMEIRKMEGYPQTSEF